MLYLLVHKHGKCGAELPCELATLLALKQLEGSKKCTHQLSSYQECQIHRWKVSSTTSATSVIRKLD